MKQISKEQRKKDLEVMNKITAKSKATQKDIDEISKKIKRAAAIRFEEFCKKLNDSKNN